MKKAILFILLAGMLGWAVYDFTSSGEEGTEEESGAVMTSPVEEKKKDEAKEVGLGIGKTAPDFTLQTLDGETTSLKDYRGQRVIVNFWATWCPPCRAEIPDFQKLYENEEVEILAVNMTETEDSVEYVQQFVSDFGMTFPVLMDEGSVVTDQFQIRAYPTSLMIDSKGVVQYSALGAMNYDQMVQQLSKME